MSRVRSLHLLLRHPGRVPADDGDVEVLVVERERGSRAVAECFAKRIRIGLARLLAELLLDGFLAAEIDAEVAGHRHNGIGIASASTCR